MSAYIIVYTSRAADAAITDMYGEAEQILAHARERNPRDNLGGALLITDDRFVQALEGDKAAVEATFDRISLDPRHTDIELLHAEVTPRRRFADWSMAFVGDSPALRERHAGAPLASLARKKSGDALLDFMAELARGPDSR